jgi:hypothetical protein
MLIAYLAVCTGLALALSQLGLMVGGALIGIPFVVAYLIWVFQSPGVALVSMLYLSFFATGINRYVPAPLGLGVDGLLTLAWLALIFRQFKYTDWTPMKHDFNLVTLIWFAWLVIEIFNPEAISKTAWFYAMRSMGFYQLLAFGLVFMLWRDPKYLDRLLAIIFVISILGAFWGLKQKNIGLDAAEHRWLYVGGNAETHVLFGVLRVFSFYSDAGQFGASQAMVCLMAGILFMGPFPLRKRLWFGFVAMMTLVGFGISGTRGALAVPGAGAILYLLLTKNFKLLSLGIIGMATVYYLLRFTFFFQAIEPIKRMRTGLDPDNPSLQVRFRNQVAFRSYLSGRPMGGGVGSAGFWGNRFSPGTFLAETATDSWYVKIWAETGIIGLCIHMWMLGYLLGRGCFIIWHIRDPALRTKLMALMSGYFGIVIASFGNQVFGQVPTGPILFLSMPLIALGPTFDQMIADRQAAAKTAAAAKHLPPRQAHPRAVK